MYDLLYPSYYYLLLMYPFFSSVDLAWHFHPQPPLNSSRVRRLLMKKHVSLLFATLCLCHEGNEDTKTVY